MIVMTERCRCGAGLIAGLAFCVACGDRRPEPVGAGARSAIRPGPLGPAPAPGDGRPFAAGPLPHHAPAHHRAPVAHPSLPPTPVAHPSLPPTPVFPPTPLVAPPSRSSAPWIVSGVAIVAILAAAIVTALLLLVPRPATTPVASQQPSTVVVPSTTTVTAAPDTGSGSSPVSSASSTALLADQVDADRPAVANLTGRWVPQLSSKRVGTVADGITYDAADILGHYRSLASAYPDAKLLYSGDWPVFNGADYYVVVVGQPFSTATAANAWCSTHGLARDQCFAKQLSHSGGPAGTTVQR